MIIWGEYAVKNVVKFSPEKINRIFVTKDKKKEFNGFDIEICEKHDLNKISGVKKHQSYVADIKDFYFHSLSKEIDFDENELVVILDKITDIQNISNIIRTCAAFNVKKIFINKKYFSAVNDVVYNISRGTIELVTIYQDNIASVVEFLKKRNFWILALDAKADDSYKNYVQTTPVAIIFGSEGNGISTKIIEKADVLLKIDINQDVESLNVANALCCVIAHFK